VVVRKFFLFVANKKKEKKSGIAVVKLPFAKTAAASTSSSRQYDDQGGVDETKLITRVKSASSLNDEKYVAPASVKN
jgi:hypothetical protein